MYEGAELCGASRATARKFACGFFFVAVVCFFKNPSLANSSLNTRETNTGDYSESAVKRSQQRGAADCSKRGKAGAAHSFHSS